MTTFVPTLPADYFVGEKAVQNVPTGQPILISAASFETISRSRGKPGELFVPEIPDHVSGVAVDPGGFVAATKGGYKFTWETYTDWLSRLGPKLTWAAFPDCPCEPQLAADAIAVRARQEKTLEYARELWISPTCGKDDGYRGQNWSWVATVQGRNIHEYVWMAEQLAPLLAGQHFQYQTMAIILKASLPALDPEARIYAEQSLQWAAYCSAHRRVAIGSLCKRNGKDELIEACKIIKAVSEVLPDEQFHLWGISQQLIPLLQRAGLIEKVATFDTSAYNGRFRKGIDLVNAERKRMNLSQRSHAASVLIPRYGRRVDSRLSQTVLNF